MRNRLCRESETSSVSDWEDKTINTMEANNIVLIGMPACGKSVNGVLLAKILKKKFIDTDLEIQELTGKSLQEIIDEDGLDTFKAVEREILLKQTARNAVVATGGSAIYYEDAMTTLSASGTVVYIKVTIDQIKARMNNIKTRGIVMGKGQTLEKLYEERNGLYEKYADVTVTVGTEDTIEDTVANIIYALIEK